MRPCSLRRGGCGCRELHLPFAPQTCVTAEGSLLAPFFSKGCLRYFPLMPQIAARTTGEMIRELSSGLVQNRRQQGKHQQGGEHEVRSEERRVGKECVRTCRYRWEPYH